VSGGGDRLLLVAGLLLLLGGVVTLLLHVAGAPVALLEFLYDSLLSGLDVPPEPSSTAVDVVEGVSLVGGILEIGVAVALLAAYSVKTGAIPGRRVSP
jgi:hypothetical protein